MSSSFVGCGCFYIGSSAPKIGTFEATISLDFAVLSFILRFPNPNFNDSKRFLSLNKSRIFQARQVLGVHYIAQLFLRNCFHPKVLVSTVWYCSWGRLLCRRKHVTSHVRDIPFALATALVGQQYSCPGGEGGIHCLCQFRRKEQGHLRAWRTCISSFIHVASTQQHKTAPVCFV